MTVPCVAGKILIIDLANERSEEKQLPDKQYCQIISFTVSSVVY